ncbi:bZIP transcription factor [Fructilactobacillus myrtifloralis]|uniref:BZIP transcription factor n=1 Tax=Fructilactobacillus myrtifloralis TaxID=2940301 RepID=A0ABY5BN21_9LACO|nr:bZIP transcription factor [Fructilactobacillus myrtifloralis]USS85065.1 bZIP transcription factor [Fructilactobacillus myrtifloralis]
MRNNFFGDGTPVTGMVVGGTISALSQIISDQILKIVSLESELNEKKQENRELKSQLTLLKNKPDNAQESEDDTNGHGEMPVNDI